MSSYEIQIRDISQKLAFVLDGVQTHDTRETTAVSVDNLKLYLRDAAQALSTLTMIVACIADDIDRARASSAWLDMIERNAFRDADKLKGDTE